MSARGVIKQLFENCWQLKYCCQLRVALALLSLLSKIPTR